MKYGLNIQAQAGLDFVALGALNHRLDPGVVPFRKATSCHIYPSGAEFNVAANLADCFGLKTAVVSAMVDYPIGDLIAEGVRAKGVTPFYKRFAHDGVQGPNMATVYSDRGYGVRARSSSTTGPTRRPPSSSRVTSTGPGSSATACAGSTVAGFLRHYRAPPAS